MFLLDNRERELITLMPTWSVKQLAVGDAWIGVDLSGGIMPGGILIERKEVHDLEASII
jgi:ERCC4-type nuclease